MWPDQWSAFVGVLVIVLCVPGPDFFVIVRYSLAGTRSGIRAAAGNVTGLMVHTTLAAAGVSGLVAARPTLLGAVRLAGAVYLIWLGIVALRAFLSTQGHVRLAQRPAKPSRAAREGAGREGRRSAVGGRGPDRCACADVADMPSRRDARTAKAGRSAADADATGPYADRSSVHPYRDGLATNLLNPKAVLFFVGVIPQFVSPGGSVTAQTLVLAGTTLGFVVMWWVAVVFTVGRGVQPLIGPGWQRTMNGVSAVAFPALATSFLVALL